MNFRYENPTVESYPNGEVVLSWDGKRVDMSPRSLRDAGEPIPYVTKDSGTRKEYPSGFRRDTTVGKARYDLVPHEPLQRVAELMARGAEKYGEDNWRLAETTEELTHFKASAARHFNAWLSGVEDGEDHMAATVFNLFAHAEISKKLV